MTELTIATRGSALALAQAHWVKGRLEALRPGLKVSLDVIKTKGDKILDVPLAQVGGKGLFVKEIEDALLSGRAGLAVHSMKDMPSELPQGLVITAVSPREDVRDVLVSREGLVLAELPQGARVGTSSLRRKAQLLGVRPDLRVESIRGNVETRLKKIETENLDGVILAAAGIKRLGLTVGSIQYLAVETMLPAVGQGALAIETRADDADTRELAAGLHDQACAWAMAAERAFLGRLEGGCQVPIAGHAIVREGRVWLRGLVADLEGREVIRGEGEAAPEAAADLGRRVAEDILDRGGREILAQVYGEAPA